MNNLKNLIKAVNDRGFIVRKGNDPYIWLVNGRRLVFDEMLKVCRDIIKKYPVKEKLNLNGGY
jgi:hypothetical protein